MNSILNKFINHNILSLKTIFNKILHFVRWCGHLIRWALNVQLMRDVKLLTFFKLLSLEYDIGLLVTIPDCSGPDLT